MAFWATLAKTAFRSSWNIAALILVTPSDKTFSTFPWVKKVIRTCKDHRTTHRPRCAGDCSEVDIQRIDDILKVERDLDVEHLAYL